MPMPLLDSSFVPAAGGLNLTSTMIALVSLVLFVVAAAYFYRLSLPPQYPTPTPWVFGKGLLFIALVLILRQCTTILSLSRMEVWSAGFWENINIQFVGLQATLLKMIISIEIVINTYLIAGSAFLLVLFFKTRDIFPRTFAIILVTQEVLILLDKLAVGLLLDNQPPLDIGPQIMAHGLRWGVMGLMIWYVTASERSKKTFVLPHHDLINEEDPDFLADLEEEKN